MSVAEAFDRSARVRHTVDQEHPWPAKLNPKSLALNTWVENHHVRLDNELLEQVVAKGKIAGDERLIIGESESGELVFLWFDVRPTTSGRYDPPPTTSLVLSDLASIQVPIDLLV